jgi:hypothetical protein
MCGNENLLGAPYGYRPALFVLNNDVTYICSTGGVNSYVRGYNTKIFSV